MIENQIDLNQYQAILHKSDEQWKIDCFAEGRFADENPDTQLIMSDWLPRHYTFFREHSKTIKVTAFGLDTARSLKGDSTVLTAGGSNGVVDQHKFKKDKNTDIAEEVLRIADTLYGVRLVDGQHPICIDYGGGYGAGIGDWLEQAGVWVIPHIPGGRAIVLPEVYQDQRTEGYALLAKRLSDIESWHEHPFALPENAGVERRASDSSEGMECQQDGVSRDAKRVDTRRAWPVADLGDSLMLFFAAIRELNQLDAMFRYNSQPLIV